MYDACHINGTWGRKEVGWLKLLYGGGKPQIGGPSFLGGADPSRNHVLRKKTYHFQDISLRSTKGYSRCKTKVKVNNKFIQPSPPNKNTKETEFVRTILSPSWLMSYVHNH